MEFGGRQYDERIRMYDFSPEWTAEVPLPGNEYVRLTRPFDTATHQAAMGPFLDSLRKELI